MKLFRLKRGTGYYSMFWDVLQSIIIAFVIVFIPAMAFINSVTTSEYYERNYLALDLGLMTDSALASPNDFIYNYARDTKKFTFNIDENQIQVYKGRKDFFDVVTAGSYFIENKGVKVSYDEIMPIEDYNVDSETPEEVIPVKLILEKNSEKIRYFNALGETINE